MGMMYIVIFYNKFPVYQLFPIYQAGQNYKLQDNGWNKWYKLSHL